MRPENIEFIALYEAAGWSKAETAKKLGDMDRSSIYKFLSGEVAPSAQTLKLFKLILANEKPGALSPAAFKETASADWEEKIINDLRDLHVNDREAVLKVMRTMISTLPAREPISYTRGKPGKLYVPSRETGGALRLLQKSSAEMIKRKPEEK